MGLCRDSVADGDDVSGLDVEVGECEPETAPWIRDNGRLIRTWDAVLDLDRQLVTGTPSPAPERLVVGCNAKDRKAPCDERGIAVVVQLFGTAFTEGSQIEETREVGCPVP